MKIGWLYKADRDDDQWLFSAAEPDSWVHCKKQIAYLEIEE